MNTLKNQSMSTSIAGLYKHNVIVIPKVWMQGNRFLRHQLLPNTHMLSILLMQCLRVKLMHKNWVWKGIWSKCELACNVEENDSHSKLLIDLLVTLRSIYRNQAIVITHKQSLKRSKRTKKTIRKHQNQANNSCNIKQFLTVPKLCEFGLIRKFRSRASICKNNQLKRSYETQVMIKRSLNSNLI